MVVKTTRALLARTALTSLRLSKSQAEGRTIALNVLAERKTTVKFVYVSTIPVDDNLNDDSHGNKETYPFLGLELKVMCFILNFINIVNEYYA